MNILLYTMDIKPTIVRQAEIADLITFIAIGISHGKTISHCKTSSIVYFENIASKL